MRLTPEKLELTIKVALAELLLFGCTAAVDYHYPFPGGLEQAIDVQIGVVEGLDARAMLARGSMSLGEKDGSLPPQQTMQEAETILADNEWLIARYHQRDEGTRVQIALTSCSPFSATPEIIRTSAELAAHHDVRLHTHLAETLDEEDFCLQRFSLRTADYLDSVSWFGPHIWLARDIHFNAEEICRPGETGTGICHHLSSNMHLTSGICSAMELETASTPIDLGIDGSASNDVSNMILEARQVLYLRCLRYGAERITPEPTLGQAVRGLARLLGCSDIGELTPGKQADLALFKLDELCFSGSRDPPPVLLLCAADHADRVVVGNAWRAVDGAVEELDLVALIARHREIASTLITG